MNVRKNFKFFVADFVVVFLSLFSKRKVANQWVLFINVCRAKKYQNEWGLVVDGVAF